MKVLRTADWQFIKGRLEIDAIQSRKDALTFEALSKQLPGENPRHNGYDVMAQEFTRMAEWSEKLATDLAEMYDLD